MESVRLDVWLDVACLFKTRSEAQRACKGGKVGVNGQAAKPHREIHAGDRIVISRPPGRRQQVIVKVIGERHIAKADARAMYEDVTPPPTAEEIEARQMARLMGPLFKSRSAGVPDKRERRALRRLKGRG
jgi:ribosome-associated heat shock protein Hsp15